MTILGVHLSSKFQFNAKNDLMQKELMSRMAASPSLAKWGFNLMFIDLIKCIALAVSKLNGNPLFIKCIDHLVFLIFFCLFVWIIMIISVSFSLSYSRSRSNLFVYLLNGHLLLKYNEIDNWLSHWTNAWDHIFRT